MITDRRECMCGLHDKIAAEARKDEREATIRECAELAKWHGHEPQTSTAILALLGDVNDK
jgi:hypothetical protein